MDFGFSFDAAPTIDTVLYFGVSELSEMNEDNRDRQMRRRDLRRSSLK